MMSRSVYFVAVALLAGWVVVRGQQGSTPSPEYGFENGSAPPGKKEFVQNGCYQCHGFQGQGAGTGPRLAPDVIPYESFARFVRKHRDVMPVYPTKVLSEDKLRKIYDYLKSLPKAPEPSEIPLLSEK